jgi:hypothetical protein
MIPSSTELELCHAEPYQEVRKYSRCLRIKVSLTFPVLFLSQQKEGAL